MDMVSVLWGDTGITAGAEYGGAATERGSNPTVTAEPAPHPGLPSARLATREEQHYSCGWAVSGVFFMSQNTVLIDMTENI